MMMKLRINEHCWIRTEGELYCLSDLYKFMDMRNDRSSPQYWAVNRSGLRIRKMGLFRKAYWVPGCILQRGLFRKTYWAPESVLVDYAQSLTPGIFKEVRAALSIEDPVAKPVAFSTEGIQKAKVQPSTLDHKKPLELSLDDLFVAPELSVKQRRVMQDGSHSAVDPDYEAMIQRAERRTQPTRRTQPATRGTRSGSRSHVSSSRASQNDMMVSQMLLMNAVLNDEPTRSHHSVVPDTCSTSRSYDTPSHHHPHHHTPSYDPSPSYDPGSSFDGGGSSGCD